jgi:hypothetical protein
MKLHALTRIQATLGEEARSMLRPRCAACKPSSWRRTTLLMLMTRKEDHSVAGLPLLSTAGCRNFYTQSSHARAKAGREDGIKGRDRSGRDEAFNLFFLRTTVYKPSCLLAILLIEIIHKDFIHSENNQLVYYTRIKFVSHF